MKLNMVLTSVTECPSNCNECSSTTKCTEGKCVTGFAVNDAGECQGQDCLYIDVTLNVRW